MAEVFEGQILANEQLNDHTWRLRVEAPSIAQAALPGQFAQLKSANSYTPFLRTPLSVHNTNPTAGTVDFLYQVVGESTRLLSGYRKGGSLDILGPLGRGFDLQEGGFAILVAGGIGVAPLLLLAKELAARQVHSLLLFGALTADDLVCKQDFEDLGVAVACATDDGSHGVAGNVVKLLTGFLESGAAGGIYACGPTPMLRALQAVVQERRLTAQLSLEAYMACGLGVCMGCAVPKPGGGYVHACTDGPVFWEREVVL